MTLTTFETGLIALAGILALLTIVAVALWPLLDDDRRQYVRDLEKACAARGADYEAWRHEYQEHGIIYDALTPEALDAEHERLTRTADLPAVMVAPRLVPLPEAGAIEPDAVLPPGTPLPEGEIAGWVRLLVTAPLDEIPGLFNRPLALTAGGER